jgi:hypothetical protein
MHAGVSVAALTFGTLSEAVHADEAGVSYWLPGRFGSLAAAPTVPGWSMAEVYYHTTVAASGAAAAAREIQIGRIPASVNVSLNLNLNAQADLVLLNPTYTFATPVLGGQFAIGVTGLFGRSSASIDGTLTAAVGPLAVTRTGFLGDALTSVGDLYPQATLKWNAGVHNFMTYVTGDIPVGAYDSTRLANLGIGHGAIDGGGGYTYFNPAPGTNFRQALASPIISRTRIRIIRTASIFASIGVLRSFCRSRCLSVWSDMDTSKSRMTSAHIQSWADSSRVSSESDRRSDSCFRWATCRVI